MSKRFTRHPRLFTLGWFVAVVACLLALQAGGAKAAGGASYTGTRGTVSRIANSSSSVPTGVKENDAFFACSNMTDLPTPENCPAGGDGGDAVAAISSLFASPAKVAAPKASNAGTAARTGSLVANFNGVSDDDNAAANGFHVTPPDQGLCVGAAGPLKHAGLPLGVGNNKSVVVEPVNDAFSIYSTSGTLLLGPLSLAALFDDPNASGDVSCNYDPATQTYFFTEIGGLLSGPDAGNFGTDLAVISPSGYAPYQVDTSVGANCFPDFPHQGYDDNAFFISINEFCGPDEDFVGANLYAFSKSQLVGLASSVNEVTFGPLVLKSIPVLALQPAAGGGTSTEYLLNSVPYDQFGNSASIAATLGYWQLTGGQHITSGSGNVTLTGQSIPSEQYAFPQPAASTGDGSVNGVITSEPFLNPDDSRMEQVQYANGTLYGSLNTALLVGNNPSPVDGAAWFAVNANKGKVSNQGYLGVAKTYLLYPSILVSGSGTLVLDFSMTSPKLNPSTGYAISKNGGNSFGAVQTTANGSGPHESFSDVLFDENRWGDYSAIALDPSSGNVWMADEYTVPTAAAPVDNWGTRVWALTP